MKVSVIGIDCVCRILYSTVSFGSRYLNQCRPDSFLKSTTTHRGDQNVGFSNVYRRLVFQAYNLDRGTETHSKSPRYNCSCT